MKRVLLSLIYFLPAFLFAQFNYPATKKVDTVTNYHGTMVAILIDGWKMTEVKKPNNG
jgi:hypothetical protein